MFEIKQKFKEISYHNSFIFTSLFYTVNKILQIIIYSVSFKSYKIVDT
jgi:hypothetical protein